MFLLRYKIFSFQKCEAHEMLIGESKTRNRHITHCRIRLSCIDSKSN